MEQRWTALTPFWLLADEMVNGESLTTADPRVVFQRGLHPPSSGKGSGTCASSPSLPPLLLSLCPLWGNDELSGAVATGSRMSSGIDLLRHSRSRRGMNRDVTLVLCWSWCRGWWWWWWWWWWLLLWLWLWCGCGWLRVGVPGWLACRHR